MWFGVCELHAMSSGDYTTASLSEFWHGFESARARFRVCSPCWVCERSLYRKTSGACVQDASHSHIAQLTADMAEWTRNPLRWIQVGERLTNLHRSTRLSLLSGLPVTVEAENKSTCGKEETEDLYELVIIQSDLRQASALLRQPK